MEKSYGKKLNTNDLISPLEKQRLNNKLKAFEAKDEGEFESNIGSMDLHKLQSMCIAVGCVPTGTKPFLKKKLQSEFKKALRRTNSIDKTINFRNE